MLKMLTVAMLCFKQPIRFAVIKLSLYNASTQNKIAAPKFRFSSFIKSNALTFDYFVNFKWSDRGKYAQRTLLAHYFKALLTIIDRIEKGELSPEVMVVGHSYFFNNRTAEKLGFKISEASFFWKFNAAIQFVELTHLYSFSKGRWAIPEFWKVKRAEIKGSDLMMKKEILEKLVEKVLP